MKTGSTPGVPTTKDKLCKVDKDVSPRCVSIVEFSARKPTVGKWAVRAAR